MGYILYPQARDKLRDGGIIDRIDEARKRCEFGRVGAVFDDMVINSVSELKEGKYLDALSDADRKAYCDSMSKAFKTKRSGSHWTISRQNETCTEEAELEDFLLMLGDNARVVLRKDELFDYKRYGFDNVTAFVGSVGAAMDEIASMDSFLERGYSWESKRPDGRTLKTFIGGSEHMDLRILQTDLTPYETTDLLGNNVPFRPQTRRDESYVIAHHTTEASLLVSVLKYVHQTGIRPEFMNDRGKRLVRWVRSLGQHGGGCTEHFGGFDQDPRLLLIGWQYPIPVLEKGGSLGRSIDVIGVERGEGQYRIYIGPNNELRAAYENDNSTLDKEHAFSIMPSEVDHFVKGLFYQCAMGLGRTSADQMVSVLEFRLAKDFEKRMKI